MNNQNVLYSVEDRDFVNKAREKMNMETIRQKYKEKMIDTGKAQELEEKIEKKAKRTKNTIRVLGTIATVALIFVPADGPFGEICTALATPGLCALVDVIADIKKKILISGKREIEKGILHVDGSNEKVSGYDFSSKEEIVGDFKNLKDKIKGFERGVNSAK